MSTNTPESTPQSTPGGTPVTVALTGGRSTRMGADKATLLWKADADGTKSLAEWTVERLHAAVGGTVLIAGGEWDEDGADRQARHTGASEAIPRRRVADAYGVGPLAGLLGAAEAAPGRSLLVLACDLPLLTVASLRGLVARADTEPTAAVVAWGPDRWQPLVGVYRPEALGVLKERAQRGDHALYRALRDQAFSCTRFNGPTGIDPADWHRQLLNVNTPEDLARARASAQDAPTASPPEPLPSAGTSSASD